MRKLILILMGTWLISVHVTAQDNLKKVEGTGIYTSDEVYVNEEGEHFAKVFYITFKQHVTGDIYQAKNIRSSNIRTDLTAIKLAFVKLETNYGLQKMERVYPEAVPNDTIRYSKKGKRVVVSDHSKRYKLIFEELQSHEVIKNQLKSKYIRYIEPPEIIFATSDYPNDPYFDNQWTHKILESEKVFDITEGDENIIIGISDAWTSSSTYGVHEELEGRIPAYQSGKWVPGGDAITSHGPRIAVIAAGTNNNNKGIASLGGNMQVIPAQQSSGLPYFINLSPSLRPDVVNMSWTSSHSSNLKDDVEDLLELGVVLVGASVNDIWWDDCSLPPCWPGQSTLGEPFVPYPGSYNFPNEGYQVISVTATQLTDDIANFGSLEPAIDPFQYEERFRWQDDEFMYNYGLDNDPLNNPDSAFTDVAAPAGRIFTARGEYATETPSQNEYRDGGGATSEAAPLVTSIIGMMLSVNPDLEVTEVYDIITSTTDYSNIVVPSGAQTNTLPDGRKYNKYIGFGRVNAYKAVLASVPKITSDVTSNTTWSGYVHLENTINVDNNATLDIDPGTTVLLDDGVYLVVRPGAKLLADGTQSQPITFKRADPDAAWNRIALNSSAGNVMDWCLVEGGYINLSIASKNNTISHSTFRDATFRTMQGWHNQDGSGNAGATISYSLIENSATVGFVAQYIDVDMSYSTIRNNTQAGLYVTSGTVYPFYNNLVTQNGTSTRDGIEVMSSGTMYLQKGSILRGYNEVSNNADDQIFSSGDLIVGTGNSLVGGYNAIHGNFSGSKYLVDNNSGSGVDIYYNWWGQSSTTSGMFDGTVNGYNDYLTSDPTSNPGHNGEAPQKSNPDTEQPFDAVAAYDNLEAELARAENNQEMRDRFHRLYQLVGLSRDGELLARFNQLVKTAAEGRIRYYTSNEQHTAFKNLANIYYIKSLVRGGEYEQASSHLSQMDASGLQGYDRRDWFHLSMDIQQYHGYYEEALATIQDLYIFEEIRGADMEEIKTRYSTIEEGLRERIEAGESQKHGRSPEFQETENRELNVQTFPNPFNPATTINYRLPVKTAVTLIVYDMLGREVATLVNGQQDAGSHTVKFDALQLSSGIYIYRLQAGSEIITGKMTLIK